MFQRFPAVVFARLALISPLAAVAAHAAPPEERWRAEVLPLLEHYCFDCHGDGIRKGEFDLDRFPDIASMHSDREAWKKIRTHLDQQLMPPPDEEQPTEEERKAMIRWIDDAVFPVDPENPDPGRVTLRRLNRLEYQNTLRDLLGVKVEILELLPPDDSGYGFDNIGDVLSMSPAHLERFLEAARIALDAATHPDPMPLPSIQRHGKDIPGPGDRGEEGHFFFTSGRAETTFEVKKSGRYRLVVTAGGTLGADGPPTMDVHFRGKKLGTRDVDAPLDRASHHSFEVEVQRPGKVEVAVDFTNDRYDPDHPDPDKRDRNFLLERVSLVGPLDAPPLPKPESHRRIYGERRSGESEESWALRVFTDFGRRAFRRPVRDGEAERYLGFVRLAKMDKLGIEHGIRLGLEAMLVSPAFLYREEPQPDPGNAAGIHRIDEHALASRLSYFLWSTMPDDRLLKLADEGKLRDNLDAEVNRLLDSPRASALVENFGGQWLQLRDLRSAEPSPKAFPKFDRRLREDMRRETEMLLEHLIRHDRPLAELLDADYTFINERLARHYGIPDIRGREFRRVSLKDPHRRGLLGHGSFLLVTSHPLRTSPVLRGKFVLENLLDTAPPPPPQNVPPLTSAEEHQDGLTLRQQLEKHREDPNCSACHALMDPIGFSLQRFDADGSWRDLEAGQPIDDSGELLDGRKFKGPAELREILLSRHRSDFHRSAVTKLLTYGLGRGTDWYDKPAIDAILAETERHGGGTRAMIHAVIHSVPFQFRRGDPGN
ncbi:MAG: DUF1592 domain-containing protein [Akkermansiaceae bacterium]|nr:DUF1592 domain-containing protein [Akkermansiaceae bacterium]